MDSIKNFISQFHKPITKPEDTMTSNTKISLDHKENNSQKSTEVANRLLESNYLEIEVADNIVACNENKTKHNLSEKTPISTDSKNTKEILHDTLEASKIKNKIAPYLRFVIANKSLTITKVIGNIRPASGERNKWNDALNQPVVVERHFVNNDTEVKNAPGFDLEIGNNSTKNANDNVFDSAKILNGHNVGVPSEVHNSTHSPTTNTNKFSETECMKDQTKECLKEFDNILAEVRSQDDFKVDDAEAISLDEIEDILCEKLGDLDSTCNKHIETINLNKEVKIPNDSNNVIVGCIGQETVITRLRTEIAAKAMMEDNIDTISISSEDSHTNIASMGDNIDAISISSDDAASTDGKESIHFEVTENETKQSQSLEVTPKTNKFKENYPSNVTENQTIETNTKRTKEAQISVVKENKSEDTETNETEQSKFSKITPEYNNLKENYLSNVTENKTVETDRETEQCSSSEVRSQDKVNDVSNAKLTDGIETFPVRNSDEKLDTDDDCGYHSSDFEFISEEEAKLDGFIINSTSKRSDFAKKAVESNAKVQNDPYGAGPSSINVGRFDYNKKEIKDKRNMEHYAVPHENEFLNMFQDVLPGLPTCEIHFLENKSIRARAPMMVQYEGVGFDMNLAMQRVESSDEEYQDEAEESMKKILEMYPGENMKRKRRRRF